jgi:predicted short-subunit dehydrogenase-like oxidoreductase (DUF2520 family)
MISRKSNIAIIGAGKIAYSLVYALKKSGYNIKFIINNNLSSAKHLAGKYSIKRYSNNIEALNSRIKIFFLSIPDNQIQIVAKKLAGLKLKFDKSLFIHLSGAENISSLNLIKKRGGLTASFHLMQTFPSKRVTKINGCYAAIETNDKFAEKYLFNLADDLQLKAFKIKSKDKVRYHLAGVFTSNFLTGNVFNSEKLFNSKNVYENFNNFDFFSPIIYSTLNNIKSYGPAKALSGPVERGDIETVKRHISSLKILMRDEKVFKIVSLSYLIQSLGIINISESKYGKLNAGQLKIKKLLYDELKKVLKATG